MREPEVTKLPDVPFVNEERLTLRNWLTALALILVALIAVPRLWKYFERFDTGRDYRIPYNLSRDYWLYKRRLEAITGPDQIVMLGDSVIWGEYVRRDGALSHFLNEETREERRFINGGVNGLFPLAMEGLQDFCSASLKGRKVIVHCNLLWMSSPKADLSTPKEERFNHSRLVPQFRPRIPCYRANANERLSVVIERNVDFMSWVTHLQSAYFGDKSIPVWTLADDGGDPPRYPNSYKNPLAQITMVVPSEPAKDPLRGPDSPRHKPWNAEGAAPSQFEWVDLDRSLQWAAFQRTVRDLQARGNDVLVILGPFNEHMIASDSLSGYRKLHDGVRQWLEAARIPAVVPDPLPSELYADASHPLTSGYQLLAKRISADPVFQSWLKK